MLKSNNQITVHQRNLQVLMAEDFKIINGLSPPIMDFFIFHENTHFRNFQIISNENKKTMRHRQRTIKFRTSSPWANLLEEYKLANSLNFFKRRTKN